MAVFRNLQVSSSKQGLSMIVSFPVFWLLTHLNVNLTLEGVTVGAAIPNLSSPAAAIHVVPLTVNKTGPKPSQEQIRIQKEEAFLCRARSGSCSQ